MRKTKAASIVTIEAPDLLDISSLKPTSADQIAAAGGLYEDTIFQEQDWAERTLSDVKFTTVILRRVNLSKTRFRGAHLRDIAISNCEAALADWRGTNFHRVEVLSSRFSGFNAADSRHNDVVFRNSPLSYSVFQFATLARCLFENCDMEGASFEGSTLTHVIFRNCNLVNAQFSDTRLREIDFRGSRLEGLQISLDSLRNVTIDPTQTETIALLTGVKIQSSSGG
jgi:uncharacterized protein YjbI with pentapeptide repeats